MMMRGIIIINIGLLCLGCYWQVFVVLLELAHIFYSIIKNEYMCLREIRLRFEEVKKLSLFGEKNSEGCNGIFFLIEIIFICTPLLVFVRIFCENYCFMILAKSIWLLKKKFPIKIYLSFSIKLMP